MKYTKVRITSVDAPNRLYRILLLRDDMDLVSFSAVIRGAFQMMDEHLYEFICDGKHYGIYPEDDDFERTVPMEDYHLSDLSNRFTFVYDFGDWWEFKITVYKRQVERNSDQRVIVTEGAGLGIFEDGRYVFLQYIHGNINPALHNTDPEEGISLPWNLEMYQFSDFDAPLDLEEIQELIDDALPEEMDQEWRTFDGVMQAAIDADNTGQGAELCLQAWDCLKKVLEEKRKNGTLPATLIELFDAEGVPLSLEDAFHEIPRILMENGRSEEAFRILNEMPEVFPDLGKMEPQRRFYLFESMRVQGKNEEALQFAKNWFAERPSEMLAAACVMRGYFECENYEEAEHLLSRFTDDEEEITPENYPLYLTAVMYYRKTKQTEKEKAVMKRLEEIERMMYEDEFDDEYDDGEGIDYNPFASSLFSREGNVLEYSVDRFREDMTEERYYDLFTSFLILFIRDEPVYLHVGSESKEGVEIITNVNEEGTQFLLVYSSPQRSKEAGMMPVKEVSVGDLLDVALSIGAEGLLVDFTSVEDQIILPVEVLQRLIDHAMSAAEEVQKENDRTPAFLN